MRSFIFLLFTGNDSGEQIKKNEMGGACGTYGTQKRCLQGLMGTDEGKSHLAVLVVDEKNNIKMNLQEWYGALNWKDVAQDKTGGLLV